MQTFKGKCTIVLSGASDGMGCAFTQHFVDSDSFSHIYTLGRTENKIISSNHTVISSIFLNDYSETDITAAAEIIQSKSSEVNFALVATGLLHDQAIKPEKSLRQVNESALQQSFAANIIVSIIFAKHFSKLMSKTQPAVLAAISAHVGSISDNRLGGWYGHLASESVLNMLFKNLAIEMKRVNNLIISLPHPSTTDTQLSKPFQTSVTPEKLFSPTLSANCLYQAI